MFAFGHDRGFLDRKAKDAKARDRQDARNFPMTTEPVVEISGTERSFGCAAKLAT